MSRIVTLAASVAAALVIAGSSSVLARPAPPDPAPASAASSETVDLRSPDARDASPGGAVLGATATSAAASATTDFRSPDARDAAASAAGANASCG